MASRAGCSSSHDDVTDPGDVGSVPGEEDDDQFFTAREPFSSSSTDSVDSMEQQTEEVVQNFVYHRMIHISDDDDDEDDQYASVASRELMLRSYTPTSDSVTSLLGQHLAEIGDDIHMRYGGRFRRMLGMLDFRELAKDCAYEMFAQVMRKLFENGKSWGKVVALLCFGTLVARRLVNEGAGFLLTITQHIVRFIVTEISSWILEQGGWVAAKDFISSEARKTRTVTAVMFMAVASVMVGLYVTRHMR